MKVYYRVNGGTAAGNGVDFTLGEGVLSFASGETSKTIPVVIRQDILPEPAETIVLQLLNPAGANLGTSSFALTVDNISVPEAFTDPATTVLLDGATFNGRIFPGGLATNYWFQYGGTLSYGMVTATQSLAAGASSVNVNTVVTGLILSGYHFRLVAQNSAGTTYGIDQFFGVSSAPSATTSPITSLSLTGAALNGVGNSNGVSGTAWFEYGATTSYGTTSPPVALAASTTNVPLTYQLSGLTQNTTYHCRAVVQTSVGTVFGDDVSFTTPTPLTVRTGSFTGTAQTGIVCDGLINPGGLPATYFFEYGTDTAYGSQTESTDAGNGSTDVIARLSLNDLTPGTEYHFRLVGENPSGLTYGDDQMVVTLDPSPNAVVEPMFVFNGTSTSPQAALSLAADGSMWGTSSTGGTSNRGTAFKVSPAGTLTTLASFYGNTNGSTSGQTPNSGLVRAGDGNCYGTTSSGGASNLGTVFRLTSDGKVTTLVSFTGTSGSFPGSSVSCGLTLGPDGHLYGVTPAGGTANSGTIFRVTTAGVFTPLVQFTGTSGVAAGSTPRGDLVLASDGYFYGTTSLGGTAGLGTIFKVSTTGQFFSMVNFTGSSGVALGSACLGGLVQHPNGELYGMTSAGGTAGFGTIFRFTPAFGYFNTVAQFTGTAGAMLGSFPRGNLTVGADGALYGTTSTGGNVSTGLGTVFKCTTAGIVTTLVHFSGTTGSAPGQEPSAGLLRHANGNFYGMTASGGAYNAGTIFKIAPDGTFTSLLSLTPFPTLSTLKQAANGRLYGTTLGGGGRLGAGTAFALPVGGAPQIFTALGPNSGTTAWNSRGGFIQTGDGNLYATAGGGGSGTSTGGSVFRLTPAGVLSTLVSFSGISGNNLGFNPQAALIVGHDGQLWGTTSGGGVGGNFGTVFKVTSTGSQATLLNFTGPTGGNLGSAPHAPLVLASDGNYYGSTTTGGFNTSGTLFRLTPGGTHAVLAHMSVTTGSNPTGPMVEGVDGSLYGVTSGGGTGGQGTVFSITKGGVLTPLASFTGTSGTMPGSSPTAGLCAGGDGHMYGVTSAGGTYGSGTLFRVGSDGSVQSLYAFTGRHEGITPSHGLALTSMGSLYGVTSTGVYKTNLPPAPLALTATGVTGTTATLGGSVTAEGHSGTAYLEYGLTTLYGDAMPALAFGPGRVAIPLTASIVGLQPAALYHFRVVVVTPSGTFTSNDRTFTTLNTISLTNPATAAVITNEYSASGVTLAITLKFAPAPGTVLKLVSNTGIFPVNGTYLGLPQGSSLTLAYNSQSYRFQIDYAGGDGNDITLTAVDQIITFPAIPVKYVGDAAFALSATSTSGLPLQYEIVAGGASASVSGGVITLSSTPGAVTVKATQPGNGVSLGAAQPAFQTFVLGASGTGFTQISASKSADFAFGIRANGTLWAWGLNASSQLGDASTVNRRTPVQIGMANNWRQVSAGGSHAVATRADGTLWTWGLNTSGQLGDGTTAPRTSPGAVGAATDWA